MRKRESRRAVDIDAAFHFARASTFQADWGRLIGKKLRFDLPKSVGFAL